VYLPLKRFYLLKIFHTHRKPTSPDLIQIKYPQGRTFENSCNTFFDRPGAHTVAEPTEANTVQVAEA